MRKVLAKALKWDYITDSLVIKIPSLKQVISLPEEDLTLYYPSKRNFKDIPYSALDLLNSSTFYLYETELAHFSYREVMLEEYNCIKLGEILEAKVISMTNRAAFLRYKTLTLRCTVIETTNSYIKSIKEYFKVGDCIQVKVISKDDSTYFIECSFKACCPDTIDDYKIGQIVTGKVTGPVETKDGYFIELSPTVLGIMDADFPIEYGKFVVCRVRSKKDVGLKLAFYSWPSKTP